jgi:hypothetical protein
MAEEWAQVWVSLPDEVVAQLSASRYDAANETSGELRRCALVGFTVTWSWGNNATNETWKKLDEDLIALRGLVVTFSSVNSLVAQLRLWVGKVGGSFNLYGSEGPQRRFVVMLLTDPALFQRYLLREGCSEGTLERADRLVDIYRKLLDAPPLAPWRTLDDLWDLEVEIDHADEDDDLPTRFSEELMQAVMQVLFDELSRRFPVEVPVSHIFRQSLNRMPPPPPPPAQLTRDGDFAPTAAHRDGIA